ncbi:trimethylguanosine synthase-like isoform X4 [Salvia divinorum]|uniref:Trimethylguanosine synthase n=1 Tax=Salvia divinorum TaxID=28513 RepID=A0ABD1GVX6_SALDI
MDFSVDESPAAKALGPLFKLTEVHLWDDGSSEEAESSHVQESTTGYGTTSGKGKGSGRINQRRPAEIADYMPDSTRGSEEEESRSPASVLNNSETLDQSDTLKNEIVAEIGCLPGASALSNEHEHDGEALKLEYKDHLGVPVEIPSSISKYWLQRYLLFSRFDNGIKMDEEGWFSVTPEILAKHHAERCGRGSVVDLFTGVGGNAIQFAQWSRHVIAIDIDPIKIDYARHNAALYGVGERIDFIKGDSFSLAPKLKADVVFCSPPWGGPGYSKVTKFDINTMLKPRDGKSLFDAGRRIAPKIVMFLPKNVDINQLAELSLSALPPWYLEVEKNYLNGILKTVTAYFCDPSSSL